MPVRLAIKGKLFLLFTTEKVFPPKLSVPKVFGNFAGSLLALTLDFILTPLNGNIFKGAFLKTVVANFPAISIPLKLRLTQKLIETFELESEKS